MRIRPLFYGWMILSHLIAWGNPHNPKVISGEATFGSSGPNALQITASDNAIIEWEAFSISRQEETAFMLPSVNSAVLNRVTSKLPSRLEGLLHSNGKVYLINQNGVLVTESGIIDTSEFLASTLDINNVDFLGGVDLLFAGNSQEGVINKGIITAWNGDVILLGVKVRNEGEINAPAGVAAMGVGSEVLVTPKADQRITIQIPVVDSQKDPQAIGLSQEGVITALQAELKADGNPYALAIQNSGFVNAVCTERAKGRIFLVSQGGHTSNTGILSATGVNSVGGEIQILGESVTLSDHAQIDVSGDLGGGSVLIGGGYQGQDSSVYNASYAFVDDTVSIKADALRLGNGGNVIVWSNENTHFFGTISARGGYEGGDGGFVEVSSKNYLGYFGFADRRAPNGLSGTLLLDPTDITISNAADSNIMFAAMTYTGTASTANINIATLLTNLASGNVTITTASAFAGNGDITFSGNMNWMMGANLLTLNATRDIHINGNVTLTNSIGSIAMNAGLGGTGVISMLTGSVLTMSGAGTLNLTAANPSGNGIDLQGTINYSSTGAFTVDTSAGSGLIKVGGGGIALATTAPLSITSGTASDIYINSTISNTNPMAAAITVTSGQNLIVTTALMTPAEISTPGNITVSTVGDLFIFNDGEISISPMGTGAISLMIGGTAYLAAGAGPAIITGGTGDVDIIVTGNLSLLSDDTGASQITSSRNLTVTAGENIYIIGQPGANSSLISTSQGNLSVTATSGNLELTNDGNITLAGGTGVLTFAAGNDLALRNFSTITSGSNGDAVGTVQNNTFIIGGTDGDSSITIDAGLTLTTTSATGSIYLTAASSGQASIIAGNRVISTTTTISTGVNGSLNMSGQGSAINAFIESSDVLTVNAATIQMIDYSSISIVGGDVGVLTVNATDGDFRIARGSFLLNNGKGGISSLTITGNLFIEGGPDTAGGAYINCGSGNSTITAHGIQMTGYSSSLMPFSGSRIIGTGNITVTATLADLSLNAFATIQTSGTGILSVEASSTDLLVANGSKITNTGTGATTVNVPMGTLSLLGGTGNAQIIGGTMGSLTITTGNNVRMLADNAGSTSITSTGAPVNINCGANLLMVGAPENMQNSFMESTAAITITGTDNVTLRDSAHISILMGGTGNVTITTTSGDLNVENGATISNAGSGGVSGTIGMLGAAANILVRGGPNSVSGNSSITAASAGVTLSAPGGNINVESVSGGAASITAAGTTSITTGMNGKISIMGFAMGVPATISSTAGDLTVTGGSLDMKDFSTISLAGTGALNLSTVSGDLRIENASVVTNTGSGLLTVAAGSNQLIVQSGVDGASEITSGSGGATISGNALFMTGFGSNAATISATAGNLSVTTSTNASLIYLSDIHLSGGMGTLSLTAMGDLQVLDGSSIVSDSMGPLTINVTGTSLVASGALSVVVQSTMSTMMSSFSVGGTLFILSDSSGAASISAVGPLTVTSTGESIYLIGSALGSNSSLITTSSGALSIIASEHISLYDNATISITGGSGNLDVIATGGELLIENGSSIVQMMGATGSINLTSGSNAAIKAGVDGNATVSGNSVVTATIGGSLDIEAVSGGSASLVANGAGSFVNATGKVNISGFSMTDTASITNATADLTVSGSSIEIVDFGSISVTDATAGILTVNSTGSDILIYNSSSIQNAGITTTTTSQGSVFILGGPDGDAEIIPGIGVFIMTLATGDLNLIADVGAAQITGSSGIDITLATGNVLLNGSVGGAAASISTDAIGPDISLIANGNIDIQNNAFVGFSLATSTGNVTVTSTTGDLTVTNDATITNPGGAGFVVAGTDPMTGGNVVIRSGPAGAALVNSDAALTITAGGSFELSAFSDNDASIFSGDNTTFNIANAFTMAGFSPTTRALISDSAGNVSFTVGGVTTIYPSASIILTDGPGTFTMTLGDDFVIGNDSIIQHLGNGAMNVSITGSATIVAGAGNAIVEGTLSTLSFTTTKNIFILADETGTAEITSGADLTVASSAGSISVIGSLAGSNTASINNNSGALSVTAATDITVQDNGTIFTSTGAGTITVVASSNININNNASIEHLDTGTVNVTAGNNLLVKSGIDGPAFVSGSDIVNVMGTTGSLDIIANGNAAYISGGNTTSVTFMAGRIRLAGDPPLNPAYIQTTDGDLTVTGASFDLVDFASINLLAGAGTLSITDLIGDMRVSNLSFLRNIGTGPTLISLANSMFLTGGSSGDTSIIYNTSPLTLTATGNIYLQSDLNGSASIFGAASMTITSSQNISLNGTITGMPALFVTTGGNIAVTAGGELAVRDNASIDLAAGAGSVSLSTIGNDIVIENDAFVRTQGSGSVSVIAAGNLSLQAGAIGSAFISGNGMMTVTAGGILDIGSQFNFEASIIANGNTNITASELNMTGINNLLPSTIQNSIGNLTLTIGGNANLNPSASIHLMGGTGDFSMTVGGDLVVINGSSLQSDSTLGLMTVDVAGTTNLASGAASAFIATTTSPMGGSFSTGGTLFILADSFGSAAIAFAGPGSVTSGQSIHLIGYFPEGNTASISTASGTLAVTALQNVTLYDNAQIFIQSGAGALSVTATTGDLIVDNGSNIKQLGTGSLTAIAGGNALVKGGLAGNSAISNTSDMTVTIGGSLDVQSVATGSALISASGIATITVTDKVKLSGFDIMNTASIFDATGTLSVTGSSVELIDFANINLADSLGVGTLTVTSSDFDIIVYNNSFIQNLGIGNTTTSSAGSLFILAGDSGDAIISPGGGQYSLNIDGNLTMVADIGGGSYILGEGPIAISVTENILLNGYSTLNLAQIGTDTTIGGISIAALNNINIQNNAEIAFTSVASTGDILVTSTVGDITVENAASIVNPGSLGDTTISTIAGNVIVRSGSEGDALIQGMNTMTLIAGSNLEIEAISGAAASVLASGDSVVSVGADLLMTGNIAKPALLRNDTGDFIISVDGNASLNPSAVLELTGGSGDFTLSVGNDLVVINNSRIETDSATGLMNISVGGASNIASGAGSVIVTSTISPLGGSFISGGSIFILADASGTAGISFAGPATVSSTNESIHMLGSSLGSNGATIQTSAGSLTVTAAEHITLYDLCEITVTAGAGTLTVTASAGDLIVDNGSTLEQQGTGVVFASSGGNALVKAGLAGNSSIISNSDLTLTVGGSLDIQAVSTGSATVSANGIATVNVSDKIKLSGFDVTNNATIFDLSGNLTVVGSSVELIDFSSINLADMNAGILSVTSINFDIVVYNNSFIQNLGFGGTSTSSAGSVFIIGGPNGDASILPGIGDYTLSITGDLNLIADIGGGAYITGSGAITAIVSDNVLLNGYSAVNLAQISTDGVGSNVTITAGSKVNVQNNAMITLATGASTGNLTVTATTGDITVENAATVVNPGTLGTVTIESTAGNVIIRAGNDGGALVQSMGDVTLTAGEAFEIEALSGNTASLLASGDTTITVGEAFRVLGFDSSTLALIQNDSGFVDITVGGTTTIYPHASIFLTGGSGNFSMTLGDDMIMGDNATVRSDATGPMTIDITGSATLVAGAGNAIVEGTITTLSFTATKNIFILADQTGFSEITSGLDLTVISSLGSISALGSIAGANTATIHNIDGALTVTAATDITLQDHGQIYTSSGIVSQSVTAVGGSININNDSYIQHQGTGAVSVFAAEDILIKSGFEGNAFIRGNDVVTVTAATGNLDIEAQDGGPAFISGGSTTSVIASLGRVRIAGNTFVNNAYITTTASDLTVTGASFNLIDFANITLTGGSGTLTINDLIGDFRVSNASFIRNFGTGPMNLNVVSSIFVTGGINGDAGLIYTTGAFNLNASGDINFKSDLGGSAYISGNNDLIIGAMVVPNNIYIIGEAAGISAAYFTTTTGIIDINTFGEIVIRDNAYIDLTGGTNDVNVNTMGGDLVVENNAFIRNQGTGNQSITSAANLNVRAGFNGNAYILGNGQLILSAAGLLDVESQVLGSATVTSNGTTIVTANSINLLGLNSLFPATIVNNSGNMTITAGLTTLTAHSTISLVGGAGNFLMTVNEDLLVADDSIISSLASGSGTTMTISVADSATLLAAGGNAAILSDAETFSLTATNRLSLLSTPNGTATITSNSTNFANINAGDIILSGDPTGISIAQIVATNGDLTVTSADNLTVRDNASIFLRGGAGTLTINAASGDMNIENNSFVTNAGTGPVVGIVGGNALITGGNDGGAILSGNAALTYTVGGILAIEAVDNGAASIQSAGDTLISSEALRILGALDMVRAQILNATGDLTITTGLTTIVPHADVLLTGGMGSFTFTIGDDLILANDSFIINSASGPLTIGVTGSGALIAGAGNAIIQGVISTTSFITGKNIWILSDSTGIAEVISGSDLTVTSTGGSINVAGSIAGSNIASINNSSGPLTVTALTDITLQDFASIFSSTGASTITVDAINDNLNIINNSFINHFGTGAVVVTSGADTLIKAGLQGASFINGNLTVNVTTDGNLDILADAGGAAFIAGADTSTVTALGRIHIAGHSLVNAAFIQTLAGDLTVTGGSYDILDFGSVNLIGGAGTLTVNNLAGDFRLSNASFVRNLGTGPTNINLANSLFTTGGSDGASAFLYNTGAFNLNCTGLISFQADIGGSAYIMGANTLTILGSNAVNIVGIDSGPAAFFTTTAGDIDILAATGLVIRDNANIDLATPLGSGHIALTTSSGDIVIENNAFVRNQGTGFETVLSGGNLAIRSGAGGDAAILGNGNLTMNALGLLDVESQLGGAASVISNGLTLINAESINMRGENPFNLAVIVDGSGNMFITAGLTTLTAHSRIVLSGGTGSFVMNISDDLYIEDNSIIVNAATGPLGLILVSGSASLIAGAGDASIINSGTIFSLTCGDHLTLASDTNGIANIITNSATASVSAENILLAGDPDGANFAQILALNGQLLVTALTNLSVQDNSSILINSGNGLLQLIAASGDFNVANGSSASHLGTGAVVAISGANGLIKAGPVGNSLISGNSDVTYVAAGELTIEAVNTGTASILGQGDVTVVAGSELNILGATTLQRAAIINSPPALSAGDLVVVVGSDATVVPHSDILLTSGTGTYTFVAAGDLILSNDSFFTNSASNGMAVIIGGSSIVAAGAGNAIVQSVISTGLFTAAKHIYILSDSTGIAEINAATLLTVTSVGGGINVNGSIAGLNFASINNGSGPLTVTAFTDITLQDLGSIFSAAGTSAVSVTATTGNLNLINDSFIDHLGAGPVNTFAGADMLVKAGIQGASFVNSGASITSITTGNLDILADAGGSAFIAGTTSSSVTAGGRIRIAGNSLLNSAFIQTLAGNLTVTGGSYDIIDFGSINLLGGAGTLTVNNTAEDFRVANASFVRNLGSGTTLINLANSLFATGGSDGAAGFIYNTGTFTLNCLGLIIFQADIGGGAFITGANTLAITGTSTISILGVPSGPSSFFTTTAGDISVNTAGEILIRDSAYIDLASPMGSGFVTVVASSDIIVENQAFIRNQGTGNNTIITAANLAIRGAASGDASITGNANLTVIASGLLDMEGQLGGGSSTFSNGDTVFVVGELNMRSVDAFSPANITNLSGDLSVITGLATLSANAQINLSGGIGNYSFISSDNIFVDSNSSLNNFSSGTFNLLASGSINFIAGGGTATILNLGITFNVSAGNFLNLIADPSGAVVFTTLSSNATISANNVLLSGDPAGIAPASILIASGTASITSENNITARDTASIVLGSGAGTLSLVTINGDINFENNASLLQLGIGDIAVIAGANCNFISGFTGPTNVLGNNNISIVAAGDLNVEAASSQPSNLIATNNLIMVVDNLKTKGFSSVIRSIVASDNGDLILVANNVNHLRHSTIGINGGTTGDLILAVAQDLLAFDDTAIFNNGIGANTIFNVGGNIAFAGGILGASTLLNNAGNFLMLAAGDISFSGNNGGNASLTTSSIAALIQSSAGNIFATGDATGSATLLTALTGTLSLIANNDIHFYQNVNTNIAAGTGALIAITIVGDIVFENLVNFENSGTGTVLITAARNAAFLGGSFGNQTVQSLSSLNITAGGNIQMGSRSGGAVNITSQGNTSYTAGESYTLTGLTGFPALATNTIGNFTITASDINISNFASILLQGGTGAFTLTSSVGDIEVANTATIRNSSTGSMSLFPQKNLNMIAGSGNVLIETLSPLSNFTMTTSIAEGSLIMMGDSLAASAIIRANGGNMDFTIANRASLDTNCLIENTGGLGHLVMNLFGDLLLNSAGIESLGVGFLSIVTAADFLVHSDATITSNGDITLRGANLLMDAPGTFLTQRSVIQGNGTVIVDMSERILLTSSAIVVNTLGSVGDMTINSGSVTIITGNSAISHRGIGNIIHTSDDSLNFIGGPGDAFFQTMSGNITINVAENVTATSNNSTTFMSNVARVNANGKLTITANNILTGGQTTSGIIQPTMLVSNGDMTLIAENNITQRNGAIFQNINNSTGRIVIITDNANPTPDDVGPGHFTTDRYCQVINNFEGAHTFIYCPVWGERQLASEVNMGNQNQVFSFFNGVQFSAVFNPIETPALSSGGITNRFHTYYPTGIGDPTFETARAAFFYKLDAEPPPPPPPCPPCPPCPPPSPCPPPPPPPPPPAVISGELGDTVYASSELFSVLLNRYEWDRWGYRFLTCGYKTGSSAVLRKNFTMWPMELNINESCNADEKPHWKGLEMQQYAANDQFLEGEYKLLNSRNSILSFAPAEDAGQVNPILRKKEVINKETYAKL